MITARAAEEDDKLVGIVPDYEAEQRAAAAARAKDAAWKPSAKEIATIKVSEGGTVGALKNFCLDKHGNVLACYAPEAGKSAIRVYSPDGKLLKSLPVEIAPTAICVGVDETIFVAGSGRVLKLDATGKVLASGLSPVASQSVKMDKEVEDMVREMAKQNNGSFEDELAKMRTMLEKRRSDVTGLAATDQDIFMAVPAPSDFSYRIYRFNQALESPKLVVQKLRGCCGQMDVQAYAGKLWIPHNARHAVETLDRDGRQLSKFGESGKVKASDFGGCCEPKNMRVLADGDILAAESGPPTCIKRFSQDGKFKEVIAVVDGAKGDCVRVTVEMSPDGSRYYLLDTTQDIIRIFAAKS